MGEAGLISEEREIAQTKQNETNNTKHHNTGEEGKIRQKGWHYDTKT